MKTVEEYQADMGDYASEKATMVLRQALEDMQKEHLSIIAQAKNLDEAYYRIEQIEIK